ncbi:MAG: ribonuclease Z [Bacteroidetes bacterium]|jgi:ribonuclease Z|nr:ribonuclease Z [Flavobacteriaceae bacterium]MDG1028797.1 ribonuclease Z [Flavobacteriaceae bacterium]MDG1941215.1 ribonuclease Z [Flavobacteriaceae bacterium]NCF30392.1 ribonuclease Z [Bacteroidota bacterium]
MKLTILGCHSATPLENAHTTSQVLEVKDHLFLIDCGEGTQIQLRNQKIKFSRIKHIFISHLHGDHFYGLVGLVSTFRLLGRTADLHVYGPKGIKEVLTLQLKLANSWTNYNLFFHELEENESTLIFEDDTLRVHTLPLDHRVYTNGFLFEEKPGLRRLDKEKIKNYDIPHYDFQRLKLGKDLILEDGSLVQNNKVTLNPKPIKRYAFCSDTAYNESVVHLVEGVDLLYHEATFLDAHENLAEKTKHSTAAQAAKIAQLAKVKRLVLGHFSSRYRDKSGFLTEAAPFFDAVELAADGKTFDI